MIDYLKLRRAAEEAQAVAPGRWEALGYRGDIKSVCKGLPERYVAHVPGFDTVDERQTVRRFIAAVPPAVVIELLDEIAVLRRRRK